MVSRKTLVRQVLRAALGLAPVSAWAETDARYENNIVVVTGLAEGAQERLAAGHGQIILQVAGLNAERGMPVMVASAGGDLLVTPRFPLRTGTDYTLRLGGVADLTVRVPAEAAPAPVVLGVEPSQATIPANILRMYLQFSEPMARGQVRDAVTLKRADGSTVPSPFLTLGPELWDPTQTRVTLLLDPGRIKQGVGPNTQVGAPLEAGQRYRLAVDAKMESAAGEPLGHDIGVALRVGPAERRPLRPETWQILAPRAGSHAPMTMAFDRIMDTGTVRRLITLIGPDGARVEGRIVSDGGGWSLLPNAPWAHGIYQLVIDPELEDVSGNTAGAPFDARAGTMGKVQEPVILAVEVRGS